MIESTLRLFNAIQEDELSDKKVTSLTDTLPHGYVLDPAIMPSGELIHIVNKIVGLSGEKANNAFHKSWQTIIDTPQEVLWLQAMIHYITTYGYESLGTYSDSTVYIPHEKLDLPELKEDIPFTVIRAMTKGQFYDKIVALGSGMALNKDTLDDIMVIILYNQFDSSLIDRVENRELKAMLMDHYGIVPSDPEGFLRHLISKLTDESLVIKNEYLITKIKESSGKFLDELLRKAPDDLASIFFRYKPLFLAMKKISKKKTFFNQLRKKANKLHRPLPEDYLNNVTKYIKDDSLNLDELKSRLDKASIFRKIRLAYALNFRTKESGSIVYRVRNGKGWATEFNFPGNFKTSLALAATLKSIASGLDVDGKTIFIPEGIHYALPATEKQFTGFLPNGSYVSVPEDMIVGVHWYDVEGHRVDLDLSTIDATGSKIGWDDSYRSADTLFSGDMTSAPKPKGASELFYLRNRAEGAKIMMLNYYNHSESHPVPTKILVAHEKTDNFKKNYMVDVSNIIMSANITVDKKQNVLGLIVSVDGGNRFYFSNVSIGASISSHGGHQTEQAREYLVNSLVGAIELKDVLKMAGANVVAEKPEGDFIDLSPSALDKTTILNILK